VINEYNNMMGGVDQSDQMTTSYLSDSEFEDIMNATDVSSEDESVDLASEIPEPPQPVIDDTQFDEEPPPAPAAAASCATKKRPRPVNKAKKAKDKYGDLSWTAAEPENPMRRHSFDGEPSVNVIVDS